MNYHHFSQFQKLILLVITLILFFLWQGGAQAAGELTVEPLTWNVIGLDSNKPQISGPDDFPVGIRVCNKSGATVNNVVATFFWDSSNSYIDVRPGTSNTLSVASLANDACTDFYFEVEVKRDTNAYDTTRKYHIEVTSSETGATIYSTPTPRELFIEHLVSQNRNAVTDVQFSSNIDCGALGDYVSVPAGDTMSLNVDTTYCIKVIGTTATNGYEQIESFITLPNTIFQVLSVETTYAADSSVYVPDPATAPLHKKLYGDACYWENDPNSPNYLSCNDVGKAGGNVEITYQVHILSAPSAPLVNPEPLTTLLYDFSGSSFHYNSDFGVSTRYVYIVDPALTSIEKQFVPDTITPGGVSTIKFTISNPTLTTINGVTFDDTFPTNPAAMTVAGTPNVSYSGCGSGAFSPGLIGGENSVSFSNGSIAPNSSCVIKVDVTVPDAGDYLNTTENLLINSSTDTGNSASDTLTAAAAVSCVPGQTLATWTVPATTTNPPDRIGGVPLPGNQAVSVFTATASALDAGRTGISTILGQGDAYSWISWGYKTPVQAVNFVIDTSKYSAVSMSFYEQVDGNGPKNLLISYDNGAGITAHPTTPAVTPTVGSFTLHTIDFTGLTSIGGNTTFRISGTGALNDNSGANLFLDNISFTGCLEADPPPTVSKSFVPDTIPVNTVSTLTFLIHNTDAVAVDLTGVQVSDTLPTGVEIASSPNASTDCTGGSVSAPAGGSTIALTGVSMLAGSSCSMQVDVTATIAGQFDNISGYISSDQSGENTGSSGYATDTLTAIAAPIISKSFEESPILEGNTTTLSFTITNPNQSTALTGVAFVDPLPNGIDVMATSSTAQCGGTLDITDNSPSVDTIVLGGATLAANGSCTFDVTVTGTTAGDYTNIADNVSSTNGGVGNGASSDLIVNPIIPQVSILKQVGPSNTGPWTKFLQIDALPSNIYYRFVIENIGNVNMTSLNITDPTLGMTGDMSGCSLLGSDDLAFSEPLVPGDYAYCIYGPVAASTGSHTNTARAHATYNSTEYNSSDESATYGTSEISLVKSASPNYFTAVGDTLSYTYVVTNSGYADLLGPVTVSDDKVTVTCPDVSTVGDGDAWFDQGESVTCTSAADTLITGTDISNGYAANTAIANVSSVDSNTVVKRVSLISAVKSVVTTSEDGTSGSNVAIGEVARYRLVIDLSEGTTDAVEILDSVVTNMSYLNDGTSKIAFVSDSGGTCNVTSSDAAISGAGLCMVGDETTLANLTPTFVLPFSAITNNDAGSTANPFPTGDDPLFSLGNITNDDRDDNAEYIIIELNSLVRNYAANQDGNSRGNSFLVNFDGSLVKISNSVSVNIVEPVISDIIKSETTIPTDAGDQVVYSLEFTNSGNAPAYDILLTDMLDSVLTGAAVSVADTTSGGACGSTASTVSGSFTSPTATATVSCLNPGGTATITITANVNNAAEAGYSFSNSAGLTYTSLPGDSGTSGASNLTGSSTPGGSGDSDGERNGSDGVGGTDNYVAASNTVTTTLATPSLAKTINPLGTQYAIGATIPYQITIAIPEGVTYNAVIEETIPNNLTYVSGSLSVTFGANVSSSASAPYTDANATFYDLTGQVMTLDLGTLTSTASASANNRTVTIAFNVTVDNVVDNQSGTSFTNSVNLLYDDPNSAGQLTIPASAPAVSIIEPDLNVSKSPSTTTPTYNSTLTYALTIEHDAASNAPAYDVVITDTMPVGLTGLTNINANSDDGGGSSCAVSVDTSNSTGSTLDVRVGALPNGCTLTITYDVTASGAGGSTQTNDVYLTWTSLSGSVAGERDGADGPGGALDDYAATTSVGVTISGTPDYTITKTATAIDSAGNGVIDNAGEIISYQIEIENTGTLDITGVNVADSLITLSGPTVDTGSDSVLSAGETWVYAGNYTVTQNDMDNNGGGDGDIDNTASITSDQISPSRTSSAEVSLTQIPALVLTKTGMLDDTVVSPGGVVNVGDQITYSFSVENTGNVNLTNIVVSDPLLPGLSCTIAGPLAPGDSGNCTATENVYTLTQVDIDAGERNNTASASSAEDAIDTDSESIPLTQNPSLTLTKMLTGNTDEDSSSDVSLNDTLTFSVTMTNTGNTTLTNVSVSDTNLTPNNQTCASVAPGNTCVLTGTYVIQQMDVDAGQFQNTGSVVDDAVCPGAGVRTCENTVTTPVSNNPGIQVTKSLSGVIFDSPQLLQMTYNILVENTGDAALFNLQVTDDLASAFAAATSYSVISVLPGPFTLNSSYDGDSNVKLLAGTDILDSGNNGILTLVVLVDTGGKAETYRNTAEATGEPPDNDPVSDDDFADGPAFVDPAVTKAVSPDQAAVGDQVTYTITVFNNGTLPAADVVVTDTFPANLDLVPDGVTVSPPVNASDPPDYITITAPRTMEVRLGTLDVDDIYVITVQAVVNGLGQPPIQNTVELSTSSPTPWTGNLSSNDQAIAALNMTDDPGVRALPDTGFAPNRLTALPPQPANLTYTDLGEVWLEIPSLGVKTSIVGVPRLAGAWNVDWLGNQAGWLQGSAFPSWQGNSVVTGHVYLVNGQPGPFINLSGLRWGDQIIVHAFGQRHVYEIQTNRYHLPDDLSALKHEDQAWLTLITCRGYDESRDSYKYRIITRAVLTKVQAEP